MQQDSLAVPSTVFPALDATAIEHADHLKIIRRINTLRDQHTGTVSPILTVTGQFGVGKSMVVNDYCRQNPASSDRNVISVLRVEIPAQAHWSEFTRKALVALGDPRPVVRNPAQAGERVRTFINRRNTKIVVVDTCNRLTEPIYRYHHRALADLIGEVASSGSAPVVLVGRKEMRQLVEYLLANFVHANIAMEIGICPWDTNWNNSMFRGFMFEVSDRLDAVLSPLGIDTNHLTHEDFLPRIWAATLGNPGRIIPLVRHAAGLAMNEVPRPASLTRFHFAGPWFEMYSSMVRLGFNPFERAAPPSTSEVQRLKAAHIETDEEDN